MKNPWAPPNVKGWSKRPHVKGCDGSLYRVGQGPCVDRLGREGNGGWVTHEYVCNMRWNGCPGRVLVLETALHDIAESLDRKI